MKKFETVIAQTTDKIVVACDPKRISQVITNLVKNSVDFVSDQTGKITIKVATNNTNDCILFTVEDNGAGIPSEKVDNLFKSFYQIDTTVTRKHGGTGLGLAICKGIIEGHSGKIWVDRGYVGGTSMRLISSIAVYLESTNISCAIINNGKEGIDMIKNHNDFNLILLDIAMPDFSRYDILEELKKDKLIESSYDIYKIKLQN
jgi:hypothetical protein